MSRVKEVYMNIPLATRVHLTMVLVVTVLSLGIIDPVYLILDLNRTFRNLELWRPFTAAAFLGTPSMSWASSTYFMVQYGKLIKEVRRRGGGATTLWWSLELSMTCRLWLCSSCVQVKH